MKKPVIVFLARQYYFLYTVFLIFAFSGCTCEKASELPVSQQPAREPVAWLKGAIIARIEIPQQENERTFKHIAEKVSVIKDAGFTVIWLSCVFPISSLYPRQERTDPVPVEDFLKVEEDYGTLDDFKSLVHTVHAAGLHVVIDVAAKYTAWDSKLVMEHPDWFRANDEGGIISPNNEWSDVADLNYEHHELRKYMIEALKFWVHDAGVDGFAFQKAEMVPLDFWVRARKEVELIRPVVFLAQSNLPKHYLEAFDAGYSNAGGIPSFEPGETTTSFAQMIEEEEASYPRGSTRLRFSSVASDFPQPIAKQSKEDSLATEKTVSAYLLPGLPVKVLNFERLLTGAESLPTDLQISKRLAKLRNDYAAVFQSDVTDVKLSEQATLVAFERKSQNIRILTLLNYSPDPQNVVLQLPQNFQGDFQDYLMSSTVHPKNSKIDIRLAPFAAKILIRQTKEVMP